METLNDYYRKTYEFEAERRHNLASYLPHRITLLGLIFGGALTAISRYKGHLGDWTVLETIIAFLLSVSIFFALYFIVRFQFRHSYSYIADTASISKYHNDLESHIGDKTKAEAEILQFIEAEYVACASANCAKNDLKAGFLTLADTSLVSAAIFAAALVVASFSKDMIRMDVSTPERANIIMNNEDKTPPPPPPPPTTDNRPTPPPRRVIQENSVPPRKVE